MGEKMGTTRTDGLLIAETDENGAVTHVWVKEAMARHPRPLRPREMAMQQLAAQSYRTAGAPRQAVMHWIATHQTPAD